MEYRSKQRRCAQYVCPQLLSTLFSLVFSGPHEDSVPVDSQCMRCSEFEVSTRSVCYVYHWVNRGTDNPKRTCLSFKSGLTSNAERRPWNSKKHEHPRNSIIFFVTWVTSCIGQRLIPKWRHRRKGKDRTSKT